MNNKIYIEAEYINYTDFVNNWLLRKVQTGEEVFPGLKLTNIQKFAENTKSTPKIQKITHTPQHTPQHKTVKGWIEMDGTEANSMPTFSM